MPGEHRGKLFVQRKTIFALCYKQALAEEKETGLIISAPPSDLTILN